VGLLYPNTFLKVLDLNTGKTLGPNERGELVLKTAAMAVGYWSGNAVDKESEGFADGWFKTGDIGYYDEHGFLFVTGRFKETIKYSGNSVRNV
jgi:fatty-acyl-CoA synthase/long-chain acyl-CoA synthetase